MKRLFVLVGLIVAVVTSLLSACGVEEGGLKGDGPDAGGAGGTGAISGTCFPGAKVCVDNGTPTCISGQDPQFGCLGTTQCDACNLPNATATCSGQGTCTVEGCTGSYQNCDSDNVNGCESNKLNDVHNCGACGNDCGPGWLCNNGTCEVNECCPPPGDPACQPLRDCDGNKTNGCEVNTSNDAQNCSACNEVCNLAHAQSACSQSACVVTQCDPGYANCDGNDANGCETNTTNDAGNCGACGSTCDSTNGLVQCIASKCVITCNGGWGDCNNNVNDGCETNTNTDASHCGKCSTKCNPQNAPAACTAGACDHGACSPGYTDCDGNKANGCETHTAADTNNCGTCKNKCPVPTSGTAFCAGGNCTDNCGSLTLCNGTPKFCANLGTDVNNCGACGNACPDNVANASPTCNNGGCTFNCDPSYNKCGSACYATASDPAHCGTSCINCSGPTAGSGDPTCANSTCGISCKAPTPNKCGNACVNFQSDHDHCGNCTKKCGASETCCGGVCKNTTNDPTACGSCTAPACTGGNPVCCGSACHECCGPSDCSGGKTCQGNSCQCPTGSKDCSGTCHECCGDPDCAGGSCCSFSCKATQTDVNNCGSCGHKCHSSANGCASGSCTCPSSGVYCGDSTGCFPQCCPGSTTCSGGKTCCTDGTCPSGNSCGGTGGTGGAAGAGGTGATGGAAGSGGTGGT